MERLESDLEGGTMKNQEKPKRRERRKGKGMKTIIGLAKRRIEESFIRRFIDMSNSLPLAKRRASSV